MHLVFASCQLLSFQQQVHFAIATKVSLTDFLFEEELLSCSQISFSKYKAFILRLGIARPQDDVG
jgi:hypothetical protein|tara:strand:+ start:1348 stop:1542 length:195 start_codon:yes stop_codon:yes gene_type:complete